MIKVYDYKIKGSPKRFVDFMYSMADFKRETFAVPVIAMLP